MVTKPEEKGKLDRLTSMMENHSVNVDWPMPYITAMCVQVNVPLLFTGDPGVGKTSMIEALGTYLRPNRVVSSAVLGQMDPADVHGMPVWDSNTGRLRIAPPPYIQNIKDAQYGILFFDEITNSPQSVQAAALRGIYNREFGEIKLHKNIAIVAAGNPQNMASDGHDLTPAFANRFVHIDYKLPASVWSTMAMDNFSTPLAIPSLPENWSSFRPKAMGLVLGFLKHRPNLLTVVPDNAEDRGKAWPSARSWYDFVIPLMTACMACGAPSRIESELIEGAIGKSTSNEFYEWSNKMDLPDPEEVLKNPASYKITERGDVSYVVLTSVITAILANNTPERWNQGWRVLAHFADNKLADIAMLSARQLSHKRPEGYDPPVEVEKMTKIMEKFLSYGK